MKSFYDETESLVLDALESLVVTQPDLVLDKSKKSMYHGPIIFHSLLTFYQQSGARVCQMNMSHYCQVVAPAMNRPMQAT